MYVTPPQPHKNKSFTFVTLSRNSAFDTRFENEFVITDNTSLSVKLSGCFVTCMEIFVTISVIFLRNCEKRILNKNLKKIEISYKRHIAALSQFIIRTS